MIEKIVDWDMKLIDSNRIKLRNHRYCYVIKLEIVNKGGK